MTDHVPSTASRALQCLQELSLEKGLDDVSMRDVAKRLGISLAALQYHYASKAALLDAFVHQTVEGYRRRIDAILATSPKGELFANLVRFATLETLEWDRHSVLAMIESRATHDETAKRAILLFYRSYIGAMRDALIADDPDLAPARAHMSAILVISMLEGLPSLVEPAGELGMDADALLNAIIQVSKIVPSALA